ncbi:MAG: RdgB/HAM1 family non-canonical purine NTP pyrophosphatase [Opitutales bacterium]
MTTLIIATGNAHKAREFADLLKNSDFEVHSATLCGGMPEVDENGATFAANAQLKAQALRKVAPKEAWVLADDSGLEVDALSGAPGIYSARYAGEGASDRQNLDKLLNALSTARESQRNACFRCVICLIGPDGQSFDFHGTCQGRICEHPSGERGFGYDPIFVPKGYSETFAQLGDAIKSQISHRAKAVQALLKENLIKGTSGTF